MKAKKRLAERPSSDDDDDRDGPYFIPSRLPSTPVNRGYLPVRLWALILLMQRAFPSAPTFDVGDWFCGKKAISKAWVRKGLKACPLDLALDSNDDT